MERRKFLKSTSLLTAAGFFSSTFPLIAGPFSKDDFLHSNFPIDKKLDPAWLKSLHERGKVTTYKKTKNELHYIGMPVGGICCGTVYVGGDGRLWLWDIFNKNQLGAVNKVLPLTLEGFRVNQVNNVFGSLYLEPATEDVRPLQQGIALVIQQDNSTVVKRLHLDDWDEVVFEATYPVATIKYLDKNLPLEVSLKAFSPFIPGDAFNSGLPVTIQSISLKNVASGTIKVDVISWLENKMLLNTALEKNDFTRVNTSLKNKSFKGVFLECHTQNKDLIKAPDFGNMAFATTEKNATCISNALLSSSKHVEEIKDFLRISPETPIAVIASSHSLKSNEQTNTDFIISWYTPNISFPKKGRNQATTVQDAEFHFYTKNFKNASAVVGYVVSKYTDLKQQTFLWHQTWYDSTLPWWFLERTFLNISTLATTTSHRFQSGRFYGWEGVGCCHGTCTHVYQYAQAMSRIFPELERDTRERVDLGVAFEEASGMIRYRGEKTGPSIDGQAGTVLRIYREYLMSKDGLILKNHWDRIKKAVEFIIQQDKNKDGMEDTPMENTLDAIWSGEISWIVGLCIAGVLAGQKMAEEMNDTAFAEVCRQYVEKGKKNMEQYLFNGEYFIHRPEPSIGKKEIGSYNTCHIDQVYGQAWAWQVGLDRIIAKDKTMSALHALWKYNYMPDVGPYIKSHPGGRFYALPGEGGMVMNTNPRNDTEPYGAAKAWQLGYFNECMSGFEHQVAAHMMAEGMVDEALVLTKTIHDRYHANKRNPFNEIECSDHYTRAMASYGTFITSCGFTYHGPKGYIAFSPRIAPEDFKAAFTAAEGWGSYLQQRDEKQFISELKLLYGKLQVKKITVDLSEKHKAQKVEVWLDLKRQASNFSQIETKCEIELNTNLILKQNQILRLKII